MSCQGRSEAAALVAVLGRSWRLLGPSGGPRETPLDRREALLGGIFGGLPREAEKSTMFDVFFTLC